MLVIKTDIEEIPMKKIILIVSCLIATTFLAANVYAENIDYSTEIGLSGGVTYTPDDTLAWRLVDGTDLSLLPQFDPSIGTLNAVTLSVSGSLEHGANLFASNVINVNQDHNMAVDGMVGITVTVPVSGSMESYLWENFSNHAGCDGSGDWPCESYNELDNFDTVDIYSSYTDSDPEMASFIGNGDLRDISVELLLALNSFDYTNLDGPEADLIADFGFSEPALATVVYDYSPVPVPASLWLLSSGLFGIMGLRKKLKM
jgi:hypothetical protein